MTNRYRGWVAMLVAAIPLSTCVLFLSAAAYLDIFAAAPKIPARKISHETSFVVFASDTNANPPMAFGGKLLAEMDRCAAITTRRFLYSSTVTRDAVTVAVDKVTFLKAANVKDLLFVRGDVVHVGTKSVVVVVTIHRETADSSETIATGTFTFVAYDVLNKKAVAHGLTLED